jgi:hypothetical protein
MIPCSAIVSVKASCFLGEFRIRYHTQLATDWKNIFQLWRENGEHLPFTIGKSTWSAEAGHFLVVEKVEIKKWPYGSAWGRYHWNGVPGPSEKISAAGTYNWTRI